MDKLLESLIACHSTPGDEGEVRGLLEASWRAAGWRCERFGDYAVAARLPGRAAPGRPLLLICAHMDSPGYSVDRLPQTAKAGGRRVRFGVTELGGPEFAGVAADAVLKTRQGRFAGVLRARSSGAEGEPDVGFEIDAEAAARAEVRRGDRVCFAPRVERQGPLLQAPFLDNRLGCWALARLAAEAAGWDTRCEVALGATGGEEMGGFGARVLAAQLRPDAALVLDATYESEEQGVGLGQGPVLTLSDATVLLSPAERDRLLALLERAGTPVQTEVYNVSGTDARAFPLQGLACPVWPLLVPTRGNHSPRETADTRDLEAWLRAIRALAEGV